ncbi:N-6 DNA methylase [Chitinophaga sp. NPDC101104]|uniref:N-6 DNA methylase n=1 Tax=Chitinophaga sp. NPDC101104 TaxID=3390561 RepID=UPI003D001537
MSFRELHTIKDNIEAIKVAGQIMSGTQPDKEMITSLSYYSGFGGINSILSIPDPNSGQASSNPKIESALSELYQLIGEQFPSKSEKVIESIKNSVLTAFYTPASIPRAIYEALDETNIKPENLLDPAAGNGIFITEAIEHLPSLKSYTAIEKDLLTGFILKAYATTWQKQGMVLISGLEQISSGDFERYDLAATNIPFGALRIFDPEVAEVFKSRIHLYYFGKTLQLVREGGIIAFLVTEAFLHAPGNEKARRQVFMESDFVAVAGLPHNLMEDHSGTSVGTHLLLLQKRSQKQQLSEQEEELSTAISIPSPIGDFFQNKFIHNHPELCLASERKYATNLYGKPSLQLNYSGHIETITTPLKDILKVQISDNFDYAIDERQPLQKNTASGKKQVLAKLPPPPIPEQKNNIQLGLFDNATEEHNSKALSYISPKDEKNIDSQTVTIIGTIQTEDDPDHDTIVVLKGRTGATKQFIYKIVANAEGIKTPKGWITGAAMLPALQTVKNQLGQYDHQYRFIGDQTFKDIFQYEHRKTLQSLPPFYKPDTLLFQEGKAGTVTDLDAVKRTGFFNPLLISEKERQFLHGYVTLRDAFHLLFEHEKNQQEPQPDLRAALVFAYGQFVQNHGQINLAINRKRILEFDQGLGFISITAIERKTENGYTTSDLFDRPLLNAQNLDITLNDPISALAFTLQEKGKVDIDAISKMCNLTTDECLAALKGKIFLDPASMNWHTASRYLSGNVVEKRAVVLSALENEPENNYLKDSLEAITNVLPAPIPFELLDFNLGERWIPMKYYSQFVSEYFNTPTTVNYLASTDRFVVQPSSKTPTITEIYSITSKDGTTINGHILMEHALENTTPHFTIEVEENGVTHRVPDVEANLLGEEKIDAMRKHFSGWITQIPNAEKEALENIYNEKFNNSVLRKYDGSHLTFPDLDYAALNIRELRTNQRDGIWRIIEDHGGLMDHDMGSGKTLIAIVASYEMRRMGLIRKPLIISLKDAVPAIAETYRKAYPNARMLYPGKDDFTPVKRTAIFNSIKHNDWDCIILTHDQFLKIKTPLNIQEDIIKKELDDIQEEIDLIEQLGREVTTRMKKGAILRQLNLLARLRSIQSDMEKNKDPYSFDELGFDYLFVDESHHFKNLLFTTRHSGAAGLGNPAGSQKALNLLYAIRYLQSIHNKDLCATFLSGTPISNSLTEMYLIFKYLRPRALKAARMDNFDAWAAIFTQKTVDFEFTVAGNIKAKERFRYFIKLPELCKFYSEIADYQSAEMIGLDRPLAIEQLVEIAPTPDQETYIQNLILFAKGGDPSLVGLPYLSADQVKARMLIATNLAQKMSLDMRLISPHYKEDPGNKINIAAKMIAEKYAVSTPYKGVQLVMCDIGTPATKGFNVYQDLKDTLINNYDIPAEEITFVHDWPAHQRLKYEKQVNDGVYRVVIGSTVKGGTGVNIQQRMVAIYNLDIPWRPPDLDQRCTRGARPGNWVAKQHFNNTIPFIILAVSRSLDAYKFNVLKNKAIVIHQARSGQIVDRSFDEGAIDESSGARFAEFLAIVSGDNRLLQKSVAEGRIRKLETLRAAFLQEVAQARMESKFVQERIDTCNKTIAFLEGDLQLYKSNIQYDNQRSRINNICLTGCSNDPEKVALFLGSLLNDPVIVNGVETFNKIGTQCGFDLYFHTAKNGERKLMAKSPLSNITYSYNRGQLESTPNLSMQARHFLFALDSIEENLQRQTRQLDSYKEKIAALKSVCERKFDHDQEIENLRSTVKTLAAEIATTEKSLPRDGPKEQPPPNTPQKNSPPAIITPESPPMTIRLIPANRTQATPHPRVLSSYRPSRGRQ